MIDPLKTPEAEALLKAMPFDAEPQQDLYRDIWTELVRVREELFNLKIALLLVGGIALLSVVL